MTSGKRNAEEPPILQDKQYDAPSQFMPDNLLHQARRQKRLGNLPVPEICILDPDGDMVGELLAQRQATRHPAWACYHTDLYVVHRNAQEFGIVGYAVGAPFAVLVAEELFAAGCRLLISVTSSGQITPLRPPPYFVLIDRAFRDEGTSYHYLPPSEFSNANLELLDVVRGACAGLPVPVAIGATWTTDAPFRETEAAITAARARAILAVEMEAAALYAFACARGKAVVCFAHVTNQMGQGVEDFEKGEANGARDALTVIEATARAWQEANRLKRGPREILVG